MKNFFSLVILSLSAFSLSAQDARNAKLGLNSPMEFQSYFREAYHLHPTIPPGLLEAVSWTNTRMQHLVPGQEDLSCMALPPLHGVMGLISDGKGVFNNTLSQVAQISGRSIRQILDSPRENILAYAAALEVQLSDSSLPAPYPFLGALKSLSEIKGNCGQVDNFALNSQIYSILTFMNDPEKMEAFHFNSPHMDLEQIFGAENYKILSASHVQLQGGQVRTAQGQAWTHIPSQRFSPDYPPALWDPAPNCNWSGRGGVAITAVTIHTTQGTYAGAISWFKNCTSGVSAHYVIRSSDGQVTQMVLESNKAWHVGTENSYTIGIEHEGWVNNPTWYTNALYTASADLVSDIINSGYGIEGLKTFQGPPTNGILTLGASCNKIKGHQHFPNQTHTDPGPHWDWDRYYKMINGAATTTTLTACSGNFYDSGGQNGNYGNQERKSWLIAPTGATSVSLTFSSFNLEPGWDYLYIYDGPDDRGQYLGRFDGTTAPGPFSANSGKFYIEFRSDCATNSPGWTASWNCSTLPLGCGIPDGLALSGLNAFGASLSWNAVPGANSYEVRTRNSLIPTWTTHSVIGTSHTLTGLKSSALHYWQVRALCGAVSSSWAGDSFYTPVPGNHTVTTCEGTFRDSGGDIGTYSNGEDYVYTLSPAGASSVSLNFTSFDLENGFDFLRIYDGPTTASPLLGTYTGTNSPGTLNSTGSSMTIRFTSDLATLASGWDATWQCTAAQLAPLTLISPINEWYSNDFNASFTDTDRSGLGLKQRFYQVLENDGQTWGANRGNGFLFETFSDSFPHWTSTSGNFYILNNRLHQTDTATTNTNTYIDLTQDNATKWLYTFDARIWTSIPSSSRRFGIHIFADNPSAANRGNSYLIWLRADNQTLEIYETVNDVLNRMVVQPITLNDFGWYGYKITYDPSSGQIDVFQENTLIGTWTDPSPLASGAFVSLRTNQAHLDYDNLRVYKSRGSSQNIKIGTAFTEDCRYESKDSLSFAGQIFSIVRDNADLWSNLDFKSFKVDFTPPAAVQVSDGPNADVDTVIGNLASLTGNWTFSSDLLSGAVGYEYAIGSSPGATDIVNWTVNGLSRTVTHTGLTLAANSRYYFSVRAQNGAGLYSQAANSDGVIVLEPVGLYGSVEGFQVRLWPNPTEGRFGIEVGENSGEWGFEVVDLEGKKVAEVRGLSENRYEGDLEMLPPGIYFLRVRAGDRIEVLRLLLR